MIANTYSVYVDVTKVASGMCLEYACLLLKAIMIQYDQEGELEVSIRKDEVKE